MGASRTLVRGLLVLALLTSGCAVGTTRIDVDHSPLTGGASARSGDLVVRTFQDLRDSERQPYIGAKRNGFGMVLGHVAVPEGQTLEGILTDYFIKALQRAGYRAAPEADVAAAGDGFEPVGVLEGDITTFWLDMYMAAWHNVGIDLRLRDRSEALLWESRIQGEESNVLWVGVSAELEKVIRQALDEALGQAVTEFSGADFEAQVRVAADRANPGDAVASQPETESETEPVGSPPPEPPEPSGGTDSEP